MTSRHFLISLTLPLLLFTNSQAQPFHPGSPDANQTEFTQIPRSIKIYKFVDKDGRVIYSSTPPEDFVYAERIRIGKTPTAARIEAARQRHENLRQSAQILDNARQRREQAREEQERKRLEWQALLNRAKPAAAGEREVIVAPRGWSWRPRPYLGHHHDGKHKPVHPSRDRRPATSTLPASSFPDMFSRPR